MHSLILFLLLCLGCISQSFAAPANDSGLIVNADQMSTDFKEKTTQLKGNVQIVFRGQHLLCDRATINYKIKRITAKGKVRLQSPTFYGEASEMTIDYENESAYMKDAYVQAGQVVFEGSTIHRTGPNKFIAMNAKYTACASCPPTWSFSGKEIEAELGGYAWIKRPIMYVGGLPVMILPKLVVPLKSNRQSGLLVPSLDYSTTGGLALSGSFFWAISKSQDMTFTGKHYELRGQKGLGEYRYVLSEESKGELRAAYIRDQVFKNEYKLDRNIDRWFIDYDHYYHLPEDYVQRMQLKEISDLRYLRDFPDEITGHGDPALQNKISLTKNSPEQHFSVESSYNINLVKTAPLAKNDDAVHTLPHIKYSLIERQFGQTPLYFRLDLDYFNFARNGFAYDDLRTSICPGDLRRCAEMSSTNGEIERDGEFDPTIDQIRTGQRLDIKPTVTVPFKVFNLVDITPQLSFRETQYRFNVDGAAAQENFSESAAQRYIENTLTMKTRLSRIYGEDINPNVSRYKHDFEPEIKFSHIPWIRRPNHAFFGEFSGQRYSRTFDPISDEDIVGNTADADGRNKLQFDYDDRVYDEQIIEYTLSNRITRKIWRAGASDYERIATIRLSQSYDFNEARSSITPQPWSAINGLVRIKLQRFETYTASSYNPYARVTNTSARVKFYDRLGDFLQLSYERIYLINDDNVVVSKNQTENYGLGAGFKTKYLDLSGQVDYSNVTSKVYAWRYLADFKPPGNCWIIRVGHGQVIGGKPEFRFNMDFEFGGETLKSLN